MRVPVRYLYVAAAMATAVLVAAPAGAMDPLNPKHCRQVPDGSQICDDDIPGPGGVGGAPAGSNYMQCKLNCGEQTQHFPSYQRQQKFLACVQQKCSHLSQHTHG